MTTKKYGVKPRKAAMTDEIFEQVEEVFARIKAKGLTQEKIAKLLNVSQGHVSKLMRGVHQPSLTVWIELQTLAETGGKTFRGGK